MGEPKTESPDRGKSSETLIYLVDDEPMLLELATVILEPLGYTVETFRGPEPALRAFEVADPQPALVISDYAMHAMTGLELAQACRRIRPNQKFLLVSGTVAQEAFHNAPVKPDGFLVKPYQAKQLSDAVKALLAA